MLGHRMRPRLIPAIYPEDSKLNSFERFTAFARKIAAVPKTEAQKVQRLAESKKKKRLPSR